MTPICFLLALLPLSLAFPNRLSPWLRHSQFVSRPQTHTSLLAAKGLSLLSNCTEEYYTQPLDHFNWNPAPNGQTTFKQRYFICGGSKWSRNQPIFFYTGNEANVVLYLNATGLMWENADSFNAIMIFAEHRYFGKSNPFTPSKLYDNKYLAFLSSDQALADYARLVRGLKQGWDSWDSPVIGFGGSYGGMLCTWFRTKYPMWVDGCISGSAPVITFMGQHIPVVENYFAEGETFDASTAGGANDNCKMNIKASWNVMFNLARSSQGRSQLQSIFRTCKPLKTEGDAMNVVYWVTNAMGFMTMGSYPYPSSYMLNGHGTLPAYPMREGCKFLETDKRMDAVALLDGIRDLAGIFYNYTKKLTCFDLNSDGNNATKLDGYLWQYMYCTEIMTVGGQDGKTDMFWYAPWNVTDQMASCMASYGVRSRPYWAAANYGAWQIAGSVTNIVFSNGGLDPWRGGGITKSLSSSLEAIVIADVGHHMDLMFSDPRDPSQVTAARQLELDHIRKWIAEKKQGAK